MYNVNKISGCGTGGNIGCNDFGVGYQDASPPQVGGVCAHTGIKNSKSLNGPSRINFLLMRSTVQKIGLTPRWAFRLFHVKAIVGSTTNASALFNRLGLWRTPPPPPNIVRHGPF